MPLLCPTQPPLLSLFSKLVVGGSDALNAALPMRLVFARPIRPFTLPDSTLRDRAETSPIFAPSPQIHQARMNHDRHEASVLQADRSSYSAVQVELVVVVAAANVGVTSKAG